MKQTLLAFILLTLATACASVPVKQQAVLSVQTSVQVLGTIQDAERAICNGAADKTKPITHCEGPAAVQAGITDAQHQQFSAALARAFTIEGQAITALRAWKAGEPTPTTVALFTADLSQAMAVVRQLAPGLQVMTVSDKLEKVIADLTAVDAALKGAK